MPATATLLSSRADERLRPYNLTAGVLHTVQAIVIVVWANRFALPVRAGYMTGPPARQVAKQTVTLFDVRFAWAIAALIALAGVNASMIGFGWMQERYESPGAGLGPCRS